MRSLIVVLLSLISYVAASQSPISLSPQEKRDGWQLLFDGQTTTGWRGA